MPIDPTRTGRDALNAGFDPTRATPPPLLGIVEDEFGDVQVHRERDGSVVLWAPDAEWSTSFTPAERDKLRELLDRAAMPGQPEKLPRAAKCPRCGLPDGAKPVTGTAAAKCEHIWHEYRPQAELEARQPLTVAAVDPAAMDALGQLADAAQDVVTKDEVDRCGWSEDPFHRCRVCFDYAAGREREHPLKAGTAQEASDA